VKLYQVVLPISPSSAVPQLDIVPYGAPRDESFSLGLVALVALVAKAWDAACGRPDPYLSLPSRALTCNDSILSLKKVREVPIKKDRKLLANRADEQPKSTRPSSDLQGLRLSLKGSTPSPAVSSCKSREEWRDCLEDADDMAVTESPRPGSATGSSTE